MSQANNSLKDLKVTKMVHTTVKITHVFNIQHAPSLGYEYLCIYGIFKCEQNLRHIRWLRKVSLYNPYFSMFYLCNMKILYETVRLFST